MPTDRTVKVRLTADSKGFIASMKAAGKSVTDLRHDIDSTNDRTAWLAQSFLALGPSLVPIGAAGVPALAGLTTQLGLTAAAAGTAVLAFNGVGDALTALNDYQVDPTKDNLEELQRAMREIGPEGAHFVRFLDSVGPAFSKLSNISRANLFPGVEDGIRTFVDDLLPRLNVVVRKVADAMGDLSSEAAQGLAGDRWQAFFEFLRTDAAPLLKDLGRTVGNFATGFANMLVGFDPLTERFSNGLLKMSRSFAEWSTNLDSNASFQDFLAYIQEVTPRVLSLFEALVGAVVQLVEAAAPVGEHMLPIFEKFFEIIAALANTPLGPVFIAGAAGIGLMGRAMALADITTGRAMGRITQRTRDNIKEVTRARFAWRDLGQAMNGVATSNRALAAAGGSFSVARERAHIENSRRNLKEYGKALGGTAGQVGLLAVAMSDLDDKVGLTNTAMGALIGSMAGPYGAAAGAAIGFTLDFTKANDELVDSIERAESASRDSNLTRMLQERARLEEELAEMRGDVNSAKSGLGGNPFDFLKAVFNQDDIDRAEAVLERMDGTIEDAQTHLRSFGAIRAGGPRGVGQMFAEIDSEATKAKLALADFGEEVLDVQGILDRSGSLIAYERALDELSESLETNGNSWKVGTEAGRANLEARNALVEKAIFRAQALKEAGDDLGAQRILNRAVTDLEKFVGDSKGARREAIQPLIDALKDIDDTKAKAEITVDNDQAIAAIDEANDALGAMLRKIRQINRLHMDIRLDRASANESGFATGGYTGWGHKQEVAGLVHRKEFVFSSEATEGNVGLLTNLHRHLRGYANGGYVGAAAAPVMPAGLSRADLEVIGVAAARAARPMFGENHFHSDGDYQRMKALANKLAAKGGG